MTTAREIATYLDDLLASAGVPDYPSALNGLQLDHQGPVRAVATAVDFSLQTIARTIESGANFLVLHHGMYWGGLQRLVDLPYERLKLLLSHDVALYASHLPLDAHPEVGNCALLAAALGLSVEQRFGEFHGVRIGVAGTTSMATNDLVQRASAAVSPYGGTVRTSMRVAGHRTRRWAVITGAGADSGTLRAAADAGIDTLITGEGPHHTTVDAPDLGLVVLYCGHYASETFGVRALATRIHDHFRLPAEFLFMPTGS